MFQKEITVTFTIHQYDAIKIIDMILYHDIQRLVKPMLKEAVVKFRKVVQRQLPVPLPVQPEVRHVHSVARDPSVMKVSHLIFFIVMKNANIFFRCLFNKTWSKKSILP